MIRYALLIAFISLTAVAQDFVTPDIIVKNRLEKSWNLILLEKIKIFTSNIDLTFSPTEYKLDDSLVIKMGPVGDLFSGEVLEQVNQIEKLTYLDLLGVEPEIEIKGFGYKINRINPYIELEEINGNVGVRSDITMNGINVYAEEVALVFTLTSKKGKKKQVKIKLLNPNVIFDEALPVQFSADFDLIEDKKTITTKFKGMSFVKVQKVFNNELDLVTLDAGDLVLPSMSVRLAGRSMNVNQTKIGKILSKQTSFIKELLLGQLAIALGSQGLQDDIGGLTKVVIEKDNWIGAESTRPDDLAALLRIHDLKKDSKHILNMTLNGDFCVIENIVQNGLGNCIKSKKVGIPKQIRTKDDLNESTRIMDDMLEDKKIKFLASISEDYINKLIRSTFEAGYWDLVKEQVNKEVEKSIEAIVGNKVRPDLIDFSQAQPPFIRMDDNGNAASVYIIVKVHLKDYLGKLSGKLVEKLLRVGTLEFPLRAKIAMKVEQEEGEDAEIKMTVMDIDLDPRKLYYGIKDYDLRSNIQDVRKILKRTIVKVIRKQLLGYAAPRNNEDRIHYQGYELPVGLKFRELNDMDLDQLTFYSDAIGRMNFFYREGDKTESETTN